MPPTCRPSRRRRARYGDLAALREGARPRQLRAALDLRRAALQHPAGRHAGAAREVSLPLHPRREIGLPGDDRAGRRLRPARHEGDGRRRTATTGCSTAPSISSATPTSPTSSSCSWRRARRIRRAASARRSPPSSSTRAPRASRCATATATSRTAATPTAILEFDDCRLPQTQVLGEVHKGFEVANAWLGATRLQVARDLPRPRRAGAWPCRSNMPRSASSSASRSASSRACRSSSPTWRPS